MHQHQFHRIKTLNKPKTLPLVPSSKTKLSCLWQKISLLLSTFWTHLQCRGLHRIGFLFFGKKWCFTFFSLEDTLCAAFPIVMDVCCGLKMTKVPLGWICVLRKPNTCVFFWIFNFFICFYFFSFLNAING